jgi:hypothetical protein
MPPFFFEFAGPRVEFIRLIDQCLALGSVGHAQGARAPPTVQGDRTQIFGNPMGADEVHAPPTTQEPDHEDESLNSNPLALIIRRVL